MKALLIKNFYIERKSFLGYFIRVLILPMILLALLIFLLRYNNNENTEITLSSNKRKIYVNLERVDYCAEYAVVISKNDELRAKFVEFVNENSGSIYELEDFQTEYDFSKNFRENEKTKLPSFLFFIVEEDNDFYFDIKADDPLIQSIEDNLSFDHMFPKEAENDYVNQLRDCGSLLTNFKINYKYKDQDISNKLTNTGLIVNVIEGAKVPLLIQDQILLSFHFIITPIAILISFSFLIFRLFMNILKEKVLQQRKLLLNLGVSEVKYTLSWYLHFFIISIIPVTLVSFGLYRWIFIKSDFILIYSLLIISVFSLFSLYYFIMLLNDKIEEGKANFITIYLVLLIFGVILGNSNGLAFLKYIFFFVPTIFLTNSFKILIITRNIQGGINFNSIFHFNYGCCFGLNLFILFIDFCLYFIISFYVQKYQLTNKTIIDSFKKLCKKEKSDLLLEEALSINDIDQNKNKLILTEICSKTKIKNINEYFNQGEIYAFYGSQGCGKSTLINIIAKSVDFESGSMSLFNCINDDEHVDSVSLACQKLTFYEELTIYENISIIRNIYNTTEDSSIEEILKTFDLINKLEAEIKEISNDDRILLGILLSVIKNTNNKVLLIDEVLDNFKFTLNKDKIWNFLRQYKENKIVIVTSGCLENVYHNENIDRIGIISNGRLTCSNKREHFKDNYLRGLISKIQLNDNVLVEEVNDLKQNLISLLNPSNLSFKNNLISLSTELCSYKELNTLLKNSKIISNYSIESLYEKNEHLARVSSNKLTKLISNDLNTFEKVKSTDLKSSSKLSENFIRTFYNIKSKSSMILTNLIISLLFLSIYVSFFNFSYQTKEDDITLNLQDLLSKSENILFAANNTLDINIDNFIPSTYKKVIEKLSYNYKENPQVDIEDDFSKFIYESTPLHNRKAGFYVMSNQIDEDYDDKVVMEVLLVYSELFSDYEAVTQELIMQCLIWNKLNLKEKIINQISKLKLEFVIDNNYSKFSNIDLILLLSVLSVVIYNCNIAFWLLYEDIQSSQKHILIINNKTTKIHYFISYFVSTLMLNIPLLLIITIIFIYTIPNEIIAILVTCLFLFSTSSIFLGYILVICTQGYKVLGVNLFILLNNLGFVLTAISVLFSEGKTGNYIVSLNSILPSSTMLLFGIYQIKSYAYVKPKEKEKENMINLELDDTSISFISFLLSTFIQLIISIIIISLLESNLLKKLKLKVKELYFNSFIFSKLNSKILDKIANSMQVNENIKNISNDCINFEIKNLSDYKHFTNLSFKLTKGQNLAFYEELSSLEDFPQQMKLLKLLSKELYGSYSLFKIYNEEVVDFGIFDNNNISDKNLISYCPAGVDHFNENLSIHDNIKLLFGNDIDIQNVVNVANLSCSSINSYKNLSYFERKKLSLIITFASKPKILLLEDITFGINNNFYKEELYELIKDYNSNNKSSIIIISTRNFKEAEYLCDKIIKIEESYATSYYDILKSKIDIERLYFKYSIKLNSDIVQDEENMGMLQSINNYASLYKKIDLYSDERKVIKNNIDHSLIDCLLVLRDCTKEVSLENIEHYSRILLKVNFKKENKSEVYDKLFGLMNKFSHVEIFS